MIGGALGTTQLGGAPEAGGGSPTQERLASGFLTTALGQPSIWVPPTVVSASTIGLVTNIPTPTNPRDQQQVATALAAVSRVGAPFAVRMGEQAGAMLTSAAGFKSTKLGAPASVGLLTASATGFSLAALGTPVKGGVHRADGLAPVQFGVCTALIRARQAGARTTAFGAPTSVLGHPATSIHRLRFGSAKSRIVLVTYTQGAGFTSSSFGTPVSTNRYRALHTAPIVRFGRGLLLRSPAC